MHVHFVPCISNLIHFRFLMFVTEFNYVTRVRRISRKIHVEISNVLPFPVHHGVVSVYPPPLWLNKNSSTGEKESDTIGAL